MQQYKHGAYGELVPSNEQIVSYNKGTIPVYIGTAPIHRLKKYSESINTPILIKSLEDAKSKLGYSSSDNFDDFTISAAIYAHFQNRIKPIGPIVIINVLDPSVNKENITKETTLINGKIEIDDYAILNTISIVGKVEGTDYKFEYSSDGKIIILSIGTWTESSISITYDKVVPKVTAETIIGGYDPITDKRTGMSCISSIYEEINVVPSIISAPGFNHIPQVEKELVSLCNKIGGHWDAICVVDLSPESKSIDEAITWKNDKGYNSLREKPVWPKGKVGDKIVWLSIITIVRMQQTDEENNNIPCETPSNKQIDLTGLVLGDGTTYKINSLQANKLNEKGITTAIYFGGKWVLWGPHMGNYEHGSTVKADEIFDVNIRTNIYLSNDFQVRNSSVIDKPITRNDLDALVNNEQLKLNSLEAEGKILYGNIIFNPKENPTSDLIQGDFIFTTMVTNTPPGKSLTNRIQYTSKGIDTLIGGVE